MSVAVAHGLEDGALRGTIAVQTALADLRELIYSRAVAKRWNDSEIGPGIVVVVVALAIVAGLITLAYLTWLCVSNGHDGWNGSLSVQEHAPNWWDATIRVGCF